MLKHMTIKYILEQYGNTMNVFYFRTFGSYYGKQREKGRKVGILEKEVALKFLVKDFVLYVHIEFEFYEFDTLIHTIRAAYGSF